MVVDGLGRDVGSESVACVRKGRQLMRHDAARACTSGERTRRGPPQPQRRAKAGNFAFSGPNPVMHSRTGRKRERERERNHEKKRGGGSFANKFTTIITHPAEVAVRPPRDWEVEAAAACHNRLRAEEDLWEMLHHWKHRRCSGSELHNENSPSSSLWTRKSEHPFLCASACRPLPTPRFETPFPSSVSV
jgi:hypothetical protein